MIANPRARGFFIGHLLGAGPQECYPCPSAGRNLDPSAKLGPLRQAAGPVRERGATPQRETHATRRETHAGARHHVHHLLQHWIRIFAMLLRGGRGPPMSEPCVCGLHEHFDGIVGGPVGTTSCGAPCPRSGSTRRGRRCARRCSADAGMRRASRRRSASVSVRRVVRHHWCHLVAVGWRAPGRRAAASSG